MFYHPSNFYNIIWYIKLSFSRSCSNQFYFHFIFEMSTDMFQQTIQWEEKNPVLWIHCNLDSSSSRLWNYIYTIHKYLLVTSVVCGFPVIFSGKVSKASEYLKITLLGPRVCSRSRKPESLRWIPIDMKDDFFFQFWTNWYVLSRGRSDF